MISGGNSAFAMKLMAKLAPHRVILADYGEMPAFSTNAYRFKSLGSQQDGAYAHRLLQACLDEEADLLIPLHAFEIRPLAASALLFNEYAVRLALPGADNLPEYFNSEKSAPAGEDWLLLLHGRPVFSSRSDWPIPLAQVDDGVFSLDENSGNVAKWRLITI